MYLQELITNTKAYASNEHCCFPQLCRLPPNLPIKQQKNVIVMAVFFVFIMVIIPAAQKKYRYITDITTPTNTMASSSSTYSMFALTLISFNI